MKIDGRLLAPKVQEELRRRVVNAVVHGGMKQVGAVQTFGVSRASIFLWKRAYEQGG